MTSTSRPNNDFPTGAGVASTSTANEDGVEPDLYPYATLPDRRRVEYLVDGDTDGFPLVFHHGTPGAAVRYDHLAAAAGERGLALILPSRPGFGESTPRPDRTVADIAPDIAGVLDDLGRSEFVTLGWSGGGPHALACAAMLPNRCRAAATGAGVAPYHAEGLEFLDGMAAENLAEYGAALAGRGQLQPFLEEEVRRFRAVSADDVAAAMGDLASPADVDYATGEFASRLRASYMRGVAHGVEGWVEDALAFTRPWGFDVGDIAVPVSVWHGTADRTIPVAHGKWLAGNVRGASAHFYYDEGHLSLWKKLEIILDDLVDQAGL